MNIWLIGDYFLKDVMPSLNALKRSAQSKDTEMPYLHQFFNIKEYHPQAGSTGIAQVINPLVDTLNERQKLPKYVLMILDKDMLANLKDQGFFTAKVMGAVLHYTIRQIDMLIESRRQDIEDKKPGAALSADLPKVIWIRMMK